MKKAPDSHSIKAVSDAGGYYIRTFTGKQFYWDKIETNPYDIRDIAHALANNCRWTGHVREFYSVAQHSIYASRVAPPEIAMQALLHDACEAYIHDTPSPLKWYLAEHDFTVFQDLENRIDKAVFKFFGLPWPRDPRIKEIDRRLMATESRDLMPVSTLADVEPYDWKLRCLPPTEAEQLFLKRYNQLWSMQNEAKKKAA